MLGENFRAAVAKLVEEVRHDAADANSIDTYVVPNCFEGLRVDPAKSPFRTTSYSSGHGRLRCFAPVQKSQITTTVSNANQTSRNAKAPIAAISKCVVAEGPIADPTRSP